MSADHPRDNFIERLSDGARIKGRYARMLPDNRPPTDDEIARAVNAITAWMQSKRLSNKDVARQLGEGFAASTISQVINNKYNGDRAGKLRRILDHMQRQLEADELPGKAGVVQTTAVRRMVRAIESVHRAGAIGVIAAPAGFGKSTVLEYVAAKTQGSVLIRVVQSNTTPVGLIKAICHAINVPYRRSTEALLSSLDYLRGTRRLLLIDEAHRLRPQALEVVRDFRDAGTSVVLAGAPELINLINDTGAGSQFYSRCAAVLNLNDFIQPGDGTGANLTPMITVEDVMMICAGDELRFTGEARELLFRIANAPGLGSLRTCQMLVQMIAQIPAARTKAITEADLWAALREIKSATYDKVTRRVVSESREKLKFA
ncbi:MAG: AAA family ATPase [Phycisphaerales bacterium]|nr:AAA family ATPase [Phycisphaerales bacterium]